MCETEQERAELILNSSLDTGFRKLLEISSVQSTFTHLLQFLDIFFSPRPDKASAISNFLLAISLIKSSYMTLCRLFKRESTVVFSVDRSSTFPYWMTFTATATATSTAPFWSGEPFPLTQAQNVCVIWEFCTPFHLSSWRQPVSRPQGLQHEGWKKHNSNVCHSIQTLFQTHKKKGEKKTKDPTTIHSI